MVVERNLQEHTSGVYETAVQLRRPGEYDIAFLLDSPRIVHCFKFTVAPDPQRSQDKPVPLIQIESLYEGNTIQVGQEVRLPFKVTGTKTNAPRTDLEDMQVLIVSPGVWQGRKIATHEGDGVYTIHFTPPAAGHYMVNLACASQGLKYDRYLTLTVKKTSGG
jgi:hypothetical protein